jgi:hypothetical protein
MRHSFVPALRKAGYTVIDANPLVGAGNDYSAQLAKYTSERLRS